MHLVPGDPFIGAKAIPQATKDAMYAKYGLDKPLFVQFVLYVANVLHGDLGISLADKRAVVDIIGQAFPVSLDLGIRSLIFAFIVGLLLGIVAAVHRGKAGDTAAMLVALIGVSVPSFIIGALIQYFLGLKLFQATGVRVFAIMGWTGFNSKILPAFALAFGSMATISRLMRTSMLDVLSQDYIKTAKAKGLSQTQIIWKHAVRNAIMPVVTVLGPLVAAVLTGAFVVENIFAIPGLGKYFVQCVQSNDYTVISGTTLFYGAFLVFANLVVDIVYGLIDPRVKLTGGKE
ncbi:MAG: ABC transporter permease [Ruminococcaceae bacterium]|jgi:oligopeptide transport system permease protein|uniref:ABC transporter permease n=2 Tax=Caproicibacterium amylolyticum TaxID=2766537 RepID=A0A7G9WLE0_9FIRM|nr:ABC transporter permease [Oscillospiraceae bacterium]QNO19502.1 ABC transporter permease [Caproicibacterium amylolyticum]